MSTTTTNLKDAIINRRSIRKVKKSESITRERMNEVLKTALHAPSSFNMQSARMVVLMDAEHEKFWDIVKETLRARVPAENFAATAERLQGFRDGAGTILFFENQDTVQQMQEKAPMYKDQFPFWSHQGSAMLQYAVWMSLTAEGIGASLQHYNPIVDEEVKSVWNIPQGWSLVAQMPYGEPNEQPGERTFLPFEDVVKFY
ncbi:nitroreductase family protein [Paenibacillus apiarius]|uniref:Nitroreductase family protein n=1 Tax=Paenibacillus apiarius TaxID=46240 RepID=A0ABT4DWC2_9BACL|nr:nitroreductase family protein [Paenibacillus apiarius]MBN3526555.1 nitroreductase family protein [Paenibacillus apiarius]MCY9517685.1 nitroreductase family protein [Paenibacillus apiarius]MCY9521662.1 nitroreductase family protein [Paenibacillus apiarius]MCY9555340.1 nitroreductase family protein [Paenibacillus apiarius]MCY9561220.1 nitroreductase family protein [Paenibacillus apiarius]